MSESRPAPGARLSFGSLDPDRKTRLDLLPSEKINATRLITGRFSLDEIDEASDASPDKARAGAVFVGYSI